MDDQNPQNPDPAKQAEVQPDTAPEAPATAAPNSPAPTNPAAQPPAEPAAPAQPIQQPPQEPQQQTPPVAPQEPAVAPPTPEQTPPAQPQPAQPPEEQTHEIAPPSQADITPQAQPAPEPVAQPPQQATPAPTPETPAAAPPQPTPEASAPTPAAPAEPAPAQPAAPAEASAFEESTGLSLEDDSDDEGSAETTQEQPADEGSAEGPQQPAMSETDETTAALSAGLSLEEEEAPAVDPVAAATTAAGAVAAGAAGAATQQQAPIPKGLGVQTTQDGPSEYEFAFHGQPEFTMATIKLPANGRIKVEAAAMVAMDTNVQMRTVFKGGLKRFLARESLFINEFISEQYPGTISIANGIPGDIRQFFLTGNEPLYLSSGAFLACGDNVQVNTEYQGLAKGFFAGAGFFLAQCEGKGSVFFNSYGGILEIDVKDEYLVDNNHIVGFTGGLEYKLQKFGGYKSLFLSGEGIVAKFSGQGKLWVQTRKIPKFVSWVNPYRRVSKGNSKGVKKFLPDSVKAFIPNK